jgi:hypothetical protein
MQPFRIAFPGWLEIVFIFAAAGALATEQWRSLRSLLYPIDAIVKAAFRG